MVFIIYIIHTHNICTQYCPLQQQQYCTTAHYCICTNETNRTDPHLIAWFSAGAFVLLGFPVSMWGILGHLTNYNAPHVQVYIVRILWMVPIYSIESWLAMRFHKKAVLIETARDVYESFVLYCFLQFLIEVLGGEEALVLMLKDKSPTRGVHMWGLQWCGVKPWLMGQPVRRTTSTEETSGGGGGGEMNNHGGGNNNNEMVGLISSSSYRRDRSVVERVTAAMSPTRQPSMTNTTTTTVSRVHWTSPFFIKCKFGVLQYVILKFLCAVAVLLLEWKGWYKEGQFHWTAGYLYICILTNVSQCWALYCLIFFYYATKTELSPIRPVGKFLSVKALVFFTWWQSVFISVLYQMDMIPNYRASADDRDWSSDDVAKGIQDYLICMEMFVAAVVHVSRRRFCCGRVVCIYVLLFLVCVYVVLFYLVCSHRSCLIAPHPVVSFRCRFPGF